MDALRRARVLFKGSLAGHIEEVRSGGSVFTYAADWPHEIACALPRNTAMAASDFGLHPVFEHLSAEGWMRDQLMRAQRLDKQDDLGLLLLFGWDCIGAISIEPIDAPTLAQSESTQIKSASAASAAAGGQRALSGIQKKLLVYEEDGAFEPATRDTDALFIAKLEGDGGHGLLRNEAYSLSIARGVLGTDEVTEFTPAPIPAIDQQALVVKRFDRTGGGAKLRMEDFAQVLSRPNGPDGAGKYSGDYREIAEAIDQFSARARIDKMRFFAALAVRFCLGDTDAHLKNWSLLEGPDGMRLAPMYDVVNSMIYGGQFQTVTALEFRGAKPQLDEVTRSDLMAFAKDIGLSPKAAGGKLTALHRKFKASPTLKPSSAPDAFLDDYKAFVNAAVKRMLAP